MHAEVGSPSAVSMDTGREEPDAFLLQLTLVAGLGGLLIGFDLAVVAGASRDLTELVGGLHLVTSASGPRVATLLFAAGAAVGALVGGRLCGRVGRRGSLVTAGACFALGNAACALAPEPRSVVLAVVVLGCTAGVTSVAAPLYLAEMAPAARRSQMVATHHLLLAAGVGLGVVAGPLLGSVHDAVVWRSTFAVAVAPALGLLFGMLALPDTPWWYASRQRWADSKGTISRTEVADSDATTDEQPETPCR